MRKILLNSAGAVVLSVLNGGLSQVAAEPAPGVQYANQDDAIRRQTDDVQRKYAPAIAQLQREGESVGGERPSDVGAAIGVDIKVGSHRENVILSVPEFKMGLQRIVLTVPEFWMGQQKLIFGTPSVRMERVQIGVHPEWFGIWRMEMKPNYMDVPKPFMDEQTIILDLPQVKMGEQEILLHLPEVSMREQRWSFDVPDFTVTDVHAELDKMKKRGADLQTRGTNLANSMKAEMTQVLVDELPKKRSEIVSQFDRGEAQIVAAITQAHKVNVDTSKAFPDGKPGLDQILRSFQESRRLAMASIDDQIAKARAKLT